MQRVLLWQSHVSARRKPEQISAVNTKFRDRPTDAFRTDSRKISHWEVFLKSSHRLSLRGLFSYKSPLFFNPKLGLKNSPTKAPDDES